MYLNIPSSYIYIYISYTPYLNYFKLTISYPIIAPTNYFMDNTKSNSLITDIVKEIIDKNKIFKSILYIYNKNTIYFEI